MIYLNGKTIETFEFNGGECHVKLPVPYHKEEAHIDACLYDSEDIMCLLLTVDALRQINGMMKINVTIPYFPYARQDRVCEDGEAFSVKVMADLINSMKLDSVVVVDPHSKMTPSLLDNCMVFDQHMCITNHMTRIFQNSKGKYVLVAPDEGALKKTRTIAQSQQLDYIACTKVRDTKTGDITETYIPEVDPKKHYVLIDDICDGGRTFLAIADLMMAKGLERKNLSLYVTHGIFSQGLNVLLQKFEHVYCYHIFPKQLQYDTERVTVFKGEKAYVH
jgi:ribose-phosphate pyrophosphokinase